MPFQPRTTVSVIEDDFVTRISVTTPAYTLLQVKLVAAACLVVLEFVAITILLQGDNTSPALLLVPAAVVIGAIGLLKRDDDAGGLKIAPTVTNVFVCDGGRVFVAGGTAMEDRPTTLYFRPEQRSGDGHIRGSRGPLGPSMDKGTAASVLSAVAHAQTRSDQCAVDGSRVRLVRHGSLVRVTLLPRAGFVALRPPTARTGGAMRIFLLAYLAIFFAAPLVIPLAYLPRGFAGFNALTFVFALVVVALAVAVRVLTWRQAPRNAPASLPVLTIFGGNLHVHPGNGNDWPSHNLDIGLTSIASIELLDPSEDGLSLAEIHFAGEKTTAASGLVLVHGANPDVITGARGTRTTLLRGVGRTDLGVVRDIILSERDTWREQHPSEQPL